MTRGGWSADEMRVLAAVIEALAPMEPADAERRAATAAETLDSTTDPGDLQRLRIALRLMDSRAANWLTSNGFTRFRSADVAVRERILLAWGQSPVGLRRTAFQALKRLGLFLAYADPGPDPDLPHNEAWNRIGYRPPESVGSPPLPSVQPIVVDRQVEGDLELDADVAVIGSGAGGGVVAARLAAAGRSVVVLEAGPYRSEDKMPTLEAHALRDMYLDRATTASRDLGVAILAGSGLGGATTINWTTTLAPPDWVRAEWSHEHGLVGFDDPQTDADIGRLCAELDLRPPTLVPPKDRLILDGAHALGWEADVTQRNAGPCTDCGGCGFGCQRGAKRSGLRAHLAAAQGDGARILVEAPVDRVVWHRGRVEGAEGRLPPGGRRYRVHAPQVVIAAGALRTHLILAASGVEHPHLGHHLRMHPTVVVIARLREPVEMWLGPTQAARSMEFARGGPAKDGMPAHGGFLIESAPIHPGFAASALPWDGRSTASEMMDGLRHLAPLVGILRDAGEGRLQVGRAGHARITYRIGRKDAMSGRRALVELARLAQAGGALEVMAIATPSVRWSAREHGAALFDEYLQRLATADMRPNRVSLFSAHQMGTARSGASPSGYPTDPHGRVRLDAGGRVLGGAYVADASLFPSAVGVNPMLTVMALAERTARAVLADA